MDVFFTKTEMRHVASKWPGNIFPPRKNVVFGDGILAGRGFNLPARVKD